MSEYAKGFISLLAHSQVILLSEVHLHHLLLYIVKIFKVFDFSSPPFRKGSSRRINLSKAPIF
ncbi:hypothetical protein DRN38_06055 [Thermococci archaeon]|nr:MAG: hypothetical protein DRN38_06055 [Thermococci archaeon]